MNRLASANSSEGAMVSPFDFMPWLKLPGSGDVWQKVTNVTDWFSPKFEMNFAGDPGIEEEVNKTVASYGRQLGILTEAVIALADPTQPKAVVDLKSAIDRLKGFQAEIEAIKKRRAPELEDQIIDAVTRLKASDPDAYKRLVAQIGK
jgi:hypothetical protein